MSIYQSFHLFTSIGKRAVGLRLKGLLVTACKRNLGQSNVFKPVVSHSVHRGVSSPLLAGIHTPLGRHTPPGQTYTPLQNPPNTDTPSPLGRHSPRQTLRDVINKWAVCILLECILLFLLPSATKLRRLCFYWHLSVHGGGGVCLSACWDTTPPGADTPQRRHPPEQTPPGSRHAPRSRHTPQEQTPPWSRHTHTPHQEQTPPEQTPLPQEQTPPAPPQEQTPLPPDTATAADGTHPTGMHSCID